MYNAMSIATCVHGVSQTCAHLMTPLYVHCTCRSTLLAMNYTPCTHVYVLYNNNNNFKFLSLNLHHVHVHVQKTWKSRNVQHAFFYQLMSGVSKFSHVHVISVYMYICHYLPLCILHVCAHKLINYLLTVSHSCTNELAEAGFIGEIRMMHKQ